jgi:hypothetical protein
MGVRSQSIFIGISGKQLSINLGDEIDIAAAQSAIFRLTCGPILPRDRSRPIFPETTDNVPHLHTPKSADGESFLISTSVIKCMNGRSIENIKELGCRHKIGASSIKQPKDRHFREANHPSNA